MNQHLNHFYRIKKRFDQYIDEQLKIMECKVELNKNPISLVIQKKYHFYLFTERIWLEELFDFVRERLGQIKEGKNDCKDDRFDDNLSYIKHLGEIANMELKRFEEEHDFTQYQNIMKRYEYIKQKYWELTQNEPMQNKST